MEEVGQEPEPLTGLFDPRLVSRIGRAHLSVEKSVEQVGEEDLHDWIVATLQGEVYT